MCCFALTFQFLRSQWIERRPISLLLHAHRSILLCFCVFFLPFGTSSSPSLHIFLFCKHRPRPPRRRLLRLRLGTSPLLVFIFIQVPFFMTSTGRIFYLSPNSTVHLPSSSSSSLSLLVFPFYSGSFLYNFNGQDLHLFPNPTVLIPSSSSSSSSSSSLSSSVVNTSHLEGTLNVCFSHRKGRQVLFLKRSFWVRIAQFPVVSPLSSSFKIKISLKSKFNNINKRKIAPPLGPIWTIEWLNLESDS